MRAGLEEIDAFYVAFEYLLLQWIPSGVSQGFGLLPVAQLRPARTQYQ